MRIAILAGLKVMSVLREPRRTGPLFGGGARPWSAERDLRANSTVALSSRSYERRRPKQG